jgi:hypothetical protein
MRNRWPFPKNMLTQHNSRQTTKQFSRTLLGLSLWVVLAGCGSGDDQPTLPIEQRPNIPGYLTWDGNNYGTWVYDALGNNYQFRGSNGCIDLSVYANYYAEGLCLKVATPSSYATWGDTNCGYASKLPDCDSDRFGVYLTNVAGPGATILDGGGQAVQTPKCRAVLGTSTGSSVTGKAVSVYYSGPSEPWRLFDVELTTPIIFTAYWDGTIPICGGNSEFAGTYIGTGTYRPSLDSSACTAAAGGESQESLQLEVDSGGVINNDRLRISGIIAVEGAGEFTQYCSDGAFTISSVSRDSDGKWVLSGANFKVTQQ